MVDQAKTYEEQAKELGIGDEGSAQAQAATTTPTPAPANVPAPLAKYDPSAVDALYKSGKITDSQYKAMGGNLTTPSADTNTPLTPAGNQAVDATLQSEIDARKGAAPAATAAAPGGVPGATLVSPGTKAAANPYKKWAADLEGNRQTQEGALNEQYNSVQRQQELMTAGMEKADELSKKREIDDTLAASQLRSSQRKAIADANERAIVREREAANIRAEEENPPNWFKEKGTAGSILAAIAMAGGAFAAAMPHSGNNQNQALGIINQAIERNTAAHDKKIQGMWKQLNLRGDEDTKKYAQDQFVLNQQREQRITDYHHASALIDAQMARTNNQSAIEGMQGLKTGIAAQIAALNKDGADQRLQVDLYQQKLNAAAAASNPFSDQKMIQGYHDYATKRELEGGAVKPFAEWAASVRGGGGIASGNATTGAKGDNAVNLDKGFEELDKIASKGFANEGLGNKLKDAVTPGGTTEGDTVRQTVDMMAGMIKSNESRVDLDTAKKIVQESYGPKSGLSEAQNKQRLDAFKTYIRGLVATKGKNINDNRTD